MRLLSSVLLALLFSSAPAWGAAATGSPQTAPLPAALKVLGALALVLGLILLLYALARRSSGLLGLRKGDSAITVREIRYLLPKKAVALIEVRGEELLLGIGPDRVEFLTRLQSPPAPSFEETLHEHREDAP